jgi:coenzyme F420-dependent glucose-6-phosphate dehydrogenase
VAARLGNGLWTLADPEQAPPLIDSYRAACDDAGKEPGEIVLQAQFSWGVDDGAALEGARVWKGAQPDEFYTDDWHDPRAMQEHATATVTDGELKEALIIAADPEEHVERIKEVENLGATVVALMNVSGADPHGAIATYRDRVLPHLR